MTRNKPRLQLALYARPKHPGAYHYALFISPEQPKLQSRSRPQEPVSATKYHVKNTLQNVDGEVSQPWRFERTIVPDVQLELRLLVCCVVAKVIDGDVVEKRLGNVPIYQTDDPDQVLASGFSCSTWVKAALEDLSKCGCVSGLRHWEEIQRSALEFVEKKKSEGRWTEGWTGEHSVPVLDLLEGREVLG